MSTTNFETRAARAAALCLLLLLAACGRDGARDSPAAPAAAAVATVEGRAVPVKLYEMFLKNGREALSIDERTEEGRRKLEALREGVVSELIDRALISAEAERRGLRVAPEMLAAREQQEIAKLGGDARFAEYLAAHNLTREDYRAVVRDMIYGELMTEEAGKTVSASDDEVRKFYEEHRADDWLQQPERVTASHVLVAARPGGISQRLQREKNLSGDALAAAVRAEIARLRGKAEDLRRRAAAGADFEALAREHSDDPASRERGGSLGTFAREAHTRAFDEAVFRLKPGEVGPLVETEFGFHVVKLHTRHPPRAFSLSEAAPEIRRRLLADKQARTLTDWLAAARRRSQVRVSEPYRFGALKNEYPAM